MHTHRVPHAKEGRDDPSIEVFGMGGIPRKFIEERKAMLSKARLGRS